MPEQTTPAATATAAPTTGSGAPSPFLGCLGCGGLALVALLVLVVRLAWNAGDATDLPRVAPEDMAGRVFRHSQEAYDAMGFTRPVRPGVERVGVSPENTLDAGYCYDGGLLGMEDKTVDGAYRMHHAWALDRVPASQAAAGLRRLHRRLTDEGWEITSYRAAGKGRDGTLYAQRDDGDERMSFDWFADRQYFAGGATAPCAYDPGWRQSDAEPYFPDSAAGAVTPPVLGPSSAHATAGARPSPAA
ncbi:hypothetical protein [Streptomyces filipinensis]|nr:hypothetical protein [Streptomyces filipinensis]